MKATHRGAPAKTCSTYMIQVYPPRCVTKPIQAPSHSARRGVASRNDQSRGTKQTNPSGQMPNPIQERK